MSTRISLSRIIAIIAVTFLISSCSRHKTAYVDIFKLVQEFELQKEYSAEAKREIEREKSIIDSVVYIERLRDPSSHERVKAELYTELSTKVEQRNKEIEALIWKRLNPYLTEFGKEKGYDYIYGANGSGTVLYADESQDITPEIIEYVNKRYHDKK